jgi:hypothetical protein
MAEDFIYDRRRIMMVVMVSSLIICSGIVIAGLWPKPVPGIGDVSFDVSVTRDATDISNKYEEIFNGSIATDNAIMVKINVYAASIYYVDRLTFTLEQDGFSPIIAVAIMEMANEANILSGKNDFTLDHLIYTNMINIVPNNYIIYFMLDISEGSNYHFTVRVGE